jgi:hypothetical protein
VDSTGVIRRYSGDSSEMRRESVVTVSASENATPPKIAAVVTPPVQKPTIPKSQFNRVQDFQKKRLMKPKIGGVASAPARISNTASENEPAAKMMRTKERTVKEIIEKVMVWRKLYNGIVMPNPDQGGKVQL